MLNFERPLRQDIHMVTALLWQKRSVCQRLQVGTVITSEDMRQVLSVGYNGPAKGIPHNACNPHQEGACGCLHSEMSALIMAPQCSGGCIFITHSPCYLCSQLILQKQMSRVFFLEEYRDLSGLILLRNRLGMRNVQKLNECGRYTVLKDVLLLLTPKPPDYPHTMALESSALPTLPI